MFATLVPAMGALNSSELTGLASYATDIGTILAWLIGGCFAVVGASLVVRTGKKIWHKFNP